MKKNLKEDKNTPFNFQRGRCKFYGSNNDDRKTLRLEIILHWTWKIIAVISTLLIILVKYFLN